MDIQDERKVAIAESRGGYKSGRPAFTAFPFETEYQTLATIAENVKTV